MVQNVVMKKKKQQCFRKYFMQREIWVKFYRFWKILAQSPSVFLLFSFVHGFFHCYNCLHFLYFFCSDFHYLSVQSSAQRKAHILICTICHYVPSLRVYFFLLQLFLTSCFFFFSFGFCFLRFSSVISFLSLLNIYWSFIHACRFSFFVFSSAVWLFPT